MTNSPGKVECDDQAVGVAPECEHARDGATPDRRRGNIVRVLGFWVLPAVALLLALGAGYFKYQEATAADADRARVQTAQIATEATVAMLSYTPDTATAKLKAAREGLTGPFRDSYTSLTDDVVIPGAQQKRISATAKVTGAASVSASENHAVVLVFVDQTTVVGNDAPTDTDSVVRVTLDRIGNRWLISGFEPI
ncbi:hypothetical protein [Mycolicibacterium pallens]|uniref:Twin-arginine translocation pathway signal n=2 Tax=Mycolicibacterium TaxID=1866885 RepID=A0A064CF41_9MYCO|nr:MULTISPECIES: hypothetical protein [Mycolicibacterium]KDE97338.1 hypothetical protein Y900_029240 [Mycolicibacterium aromaticivorans JS19b1 = JCM 16368]QYL16677.1 hypothetical protein K0O64_27460 [Mycolicibacterium pallens]